MKDEYVRLLELSAEHSERELERAITAHVEDFLREMGSIRRRPVTYGVADLVTETAQS